jgi:hypothetical protein
VTEPVAGRLRGLLGSDVYTVKGRLRADDLLVRERVRRGLGEASARLRQLASEWRADRVPPSTREQPFPRAERLGRAIEDVSTAVGGLPLMSQDRVWDRVRKVGLDELLQFDWTMVGESDALAQDITQCGALDQIDIESAQERIGRLREAMADRRRYLEILA